MRIEPERAARDLWHCDACGWVGRHPSLSDASDLVPDGEGGWRMDRTHVAVCPMCFKEVRK